MPLVGVTLQPAGWLTPQQLLCLCCHLLPGLASEDEDICMSLACLPARPPARLTACRFG